ncbi:hypothetical protein QAD02_011337 [Eretmocerus hayati]|uniref:Uncharacterized protein n=1 Tax=Eretmocerus hayati TaxID=131215 RepID=A0ACC2NY77_9HYME|nr:hypothetical protein QAD02_011337 [Eretmocerus hayati]
MDSSAITLLGLAKFSSILERNYEFNEIEKLMRDEKAILVGCLLVKLSAARVKGCATVKLLDSTLKDGSYEEKGRDYKKNDEECRSPVFNIMTMFTLSGCLPNIDTCRTIGHKSVMFALRPIKAGTPLTLFNQSPLSVYHDTPKQRRQLGHKQMYKCPCNCRACTENWPENLDKALDFIHAPGINLQAVKKFKSEHDSIMDEWHTNMQTHKPAFPDLKFISRLNKCAREAWKHIPEPSVALKMCTMILVIITRSFHNPDKNIFTTS